MAPETAFLDAVLAHLRGSAALAALVGVRIFDEVPADDRAGSIVETPYVYAGPLVSTDDNGVCIDMRRLRLRLYAVSDAFARREAWEVMHLMRQRLRSGLTGGAVPFTLPAPHSLVSCMFGPSGDITEPERLKVCFVDLVADITSDVVPDVD